MTRSIYRRPAQRSVVTSAMGSKAASALGGRWMEAFGGLEGLDGTFFSDLAISKN